MTKQITKLIFCFLSMSAALAHAGELENYLKKPDAHYSWSEENRFRRDGLRVVDLALTSQEWRGIVWKHRVRLILPSKTPGDICFLWISGSEDGSKSYNLLSQFVSATGIPAAVLTHVPNQPLFGELREDALLAYTFNNFTKSGEADWPIIFPMVKSAQRAMDSLQEFSSVDWGVPFRRFIVAGASKRGWTTWLTAAHDIRVAAIAPFVFDMLNMKQQIELMIKSYGQESEMIIDYTKMGLIERIDQPRTVTLRGWVDPYSYLGALSLPKLILLGTNDRYWVVDSLRNYFDALPGDKLIYQVPNAGHSISGDAKLRETLTAWARLIAAGKKPPQVTWRYAQKDGAATIRAESSETIESAFLWSALSADRDFRDARWQSAPVRVEDGGRAAEAAVSRAKEGYIAFYLELQLGDTGLKATTQAKVLPDFAGPAGASVPKK